MISEKIRKENEIKKAYLNAYVPNVQAVKDIEMEIEELRQEKMCPSCNIGDGLPHAHNGTDLSDYIVEMEKLYQDLLQARYNKILYYRSIFNTIECLKSEIEKRILRLKYIKGLPWNKVCIEAGYCYKQVLRIHGNALFHLQIDKSDVVYKEIIENIEKMSL